MKRVNFTLTEVLIDKINKVKKDTGMTGSELVRRSLDEWFEKREKTLKSGKS